MHFSPLTRLFILNIKLNPLKPGLVGGVNLNGKVHLIAEDLFFNPSLKYEFQFKFVICHFQLDFPELEEEGEEAGTES